ncbi:hypothetical protein LXL04_006246 [Taraxacum kok-saghyz]
MAMAVAGQDSICVKQKPSSTILPSELRRSLDDLGDSLFLDRSSPFTEMKSINEKGKVPDVFNRMLQPQAMQYVHMRLSDFGLCEEDGNRNLAIGIRRFFILHSDRPEAHYFLILLQVSNMSKIFPFVFRNFSDFLFIIVLILILDLWVTY